MSELSEDPDTVLRNTVIDCGLVVDFLASKLVNDRQWWACLLLIRYRSTAVSLLKTLPPSDEERSPTSGLSSLLERHWDFTAVAVLARTLFENHLALFYLCFDQVTDDEWLSRLNLMQLHDYHSRRKVFADLTPDDRVWTENHEITDDLETKLRSRTFFKSLDPRRQHTLLKGDNVSFLSHEEILERMGCENIREQIAMWRWWSTYVHSFPLSFYRMADQKRGTGVENRVDKGYISGTLELVTKMTIAASSGMRKLCPDVPRKEEFLLQGILRMREKQRSKPLERSAGED
jgi:hypothetical protein